MADNNSVNRDNSPDVAADDPFAELARIMNHGARSEPPAAPAEQAEPDADPFAADLEQELLGELDESGDGHGAEPAAPTETAEDTEAYEAESEPAEYDAAGPAETEVGYDAPGHQDTPYDAYDQPSAYEDGDAVVETDVQPADWEEESYRQVETSGGVEDDLWADRRPLTDEPPEPVAEAPAWETDEGYSSVDDAVLADVDMDFGDLDAHAAPSGDEPREPVEAASAPYADEMPQPAAAEAGGVSLEDELEMLLAGGAPPPDRSRPMPDGEAGESRPGAGHDGDTQTYGGFPEPAQPPQPAMFGRANFTGHDGGFAQPSPAHAGASEEVPEPGPDEQPEDADPFAALASIAPEVDEEAPVQAPAAAAPVDFETVDVPEPALAQEDDLRLPELPEEEPVGQDFAGDFETELDYAFPAAAPLQGDSHAAGEAVGASAADAASGADDDRFYAEAFGFGTAAGAPREHDGQDGDPFDADIDRELKAAMPMHAAAAPTHEQPARRNGFIIAAAVLGVALVGGIGAFALSFGGGDEAGTPVLVQADDDPVKVKPEDPGGSAVVPNPDSVAYEAAAGANEDQAPQQENLVTTTEEPVDIASRAAETERLPGVDEEIGATDGASGKVKDRLEATEAAASEMAEDVIAVQPRRVRTMIVRPDGTLVPREEAQPEQAAAAPEAAAQPAETAPPAPLAEPDATAAQPTLETIAASDEPAAGPAEENASATAADGAGTETAAASQEQRPAAEASDPVTPTTAPAVPSRPASQETSQPRQVAQAAPAATRTQPAAPAPAAAATSEWSMQIASQPSAESAQATYQELARRYGDLLDGRGVNIVRAEIPDKGTYYRVRIPTRSRDDGIQLCERYKAAGGSCFVSK